MSRLFLPVPAGAGGKPSLSEYAGCRGLQVYKEQAEAGRPRIETWRIPAGNVCHRSKGRYVVWHIPGSADPLRIEGERKIDHSRGRRSLGRDAAYARNIP